MSVSTPGNPLEQAYDLPAGPQRVFAALTEQGCLEQWFAESVRIEPRVGGVFRFWGRHTAWITRESESDGRITAYEAGQRLAYTFSWRKTRCEVDLGLSAGPAGGGESSVLAVRMFAPEPRLGFGDDCPWYMLDFWRYSIGNLRSYLRTGAAALRPDFTSTSGPLDMSVHVAAPPDRVFAALTDPAKMDQWLSAKAVVELRAGGAYSFGWLIRGKDGRETPCGPSRLVEFVPNRLVVHDWFHRDEPPSRVRWELTPEAGGTRVRLTHTVPSTEPTRGGYIGGWTGFLVELADRGATSRL